MDQISIPASAVVFFTEVVEPTVLEFLNDGGSLRRGVLAALVLTHMADHLFHATPRTRPFDAEFETFKADLAGECGAVGLMLEVANATKHLVRRKSDQLHYSAIQAREAMCGEFMCGMRLGESLVFVKPTDADYEVHLDQWVAEAWRFWRLKLGLGTSGT